MNTHTPSRQLGLEYISRVLGHEGGYVNNPNDRGGETNWGITIATARRYGYHRAMRDMNRSEAIDIYLQLFWLNRFDRFAEIGLPKLAYALLDFGVNSGNGRPAEAIQRVLNALNFGQRRWPDIAVDGAIGPQTVRTASLAKAAFDDAEELLTFAVQSLRFSFVLTLTEKSPSQEVFMLGWARRILNVTKSTI